MLGMFGFTGVMTDSAGNKMCSDPCKNCKTDVDGNYCGDSVCTKCGYPSLTKLCYDCTNDLQDKIAKLTQQLADGDA